MMGKEIVGALADLARRQPKGRLVSIVEILEAVAGISEGELTVAEVAHALAFEVYDGDATMLYWGGSDGLVEPIVGNPRHEHSGCNSRGDVVMELFNADFWKDPDSTILHPDERVHTDARDVLVLKEDGFEMARRLWSFFYPNQESKLDEFGMAQYLEVEDTKRTEGKPGYSTPLLAILDAAIAEFFEPRRNVDAKKDEVVGWIKSEMIAAGMADSDNIAAAMFTIIKPENHHPRKRRG